MAFRARIPSAVLPRTTDDTVDWWARTSKYRKAEYNLRVEGDVANVSKIFGHTTTIAGPAESPRRILSHMYPVAWFRAQQAYVAALVDNKPTNAPAKEQVYWALALMAAVTDGLFFFNVNDMVWSRAIYGDPTLLGGTSLDWGGFGFPCVGVPADTWGPVMAPLWSGLERVQERIKLKVYGCSSNPKARPTPLFSSAVPFFRGPLVGHPYPKTYLVGVESFDRPNYEAPWWSEYIGKPQAQHIPWIHQEQPLWYIAPMRVEARGQGRASGRTKWDETKTRVDGLTEDELSAMESKGGRDGVLARRYRMMVFGYRYRTWESVDKRVPALSDVVRDAAYPGSLFKQAFFAGAYETVGNWFANINPADGVRAANTDWLDFVTPGMLTGRNPAGDPRTYNIGFLARDDWKDVTKSQKIAEWADRLGPLEIAVGFIADMFSGNYASGFARLGKKTVELAKSRAARTLNMWDFFRQMPNAFLHSLGGYNQQNEGLFAYFNTCCGSTDEVYMRLAKSFKDCQRVVDSAVRAEDVTRATIPAVLNMPSMLAVDTDSRDKAPATRQPSEKGDRPSLVPALVAATATAIAGTIIWRRR